MTGSRSQDKEASDHLSPSDHFTPDQTATSKETDSEITANTIVGGPPKTSLVLTEVDKLLYTDADAELRNQLGNEGHDNDKEWGGDHPPQPKLNSRDCNLIFLMPFCVTVAITQPFIYFVIELDETYGINVNIVGLLVGAFHLCRVIATVASIFSPRASHLMGTLIGLAGYASLVAFDGKTNVTTFAISNIAVGLSDAMGTVFIYSKLSYSKEPSKMRMAMRYQMAVIGLGVLVGFFAGGMVVEVAGVFGVALAGTIALGLEFMSLLYYLVAPISKEIMEVPKVIEVPNEEEAGGTKGKNSAAVPLLRGSDVAWAVREGNPRRTIMGQFFNSDDAVAGRFTYLVAATFSFEPIARGYLHSIGPLFISETFGVEIGMIGIIYSVSSLLGSIFTFLAISSKGRKFQMKHLRSPYNIYATVILTTLSVLGLLVPSYPIQILCVILIHIAMELFLVLISELQGAITTNHYFTVLGPASQVGMKVVSTVMSFSGAPAYGVFPRLPYIIAGFLCTIYALSFIILTQKQQRKNEKVISDLIAHSGRMGEEEAAKLVKQYGRMTMASKECMARIASATLEVADKGRGKRHDLRGNVTNDLEERRKEGLYFLEIYSCLNYVYSGRVNT